MTPHSCPEIFESSHYAAGVWGKFARSLQLGPKYYLRDVPRYLRHRRMLRLRSGDTAVWLNPLREFVSRVYHRFAPPPQLPKALNLCRAASIRFTIPAHRLEGLVGAWWATREVPGDILECGVYRGATSLLLAVLARLNGIDKATVMLDTFAGIPHTCVFDPSRTIGEFTPPDGQVAAIWRAAERLGVALRVEIYPGLFEDTFPRLRARGQLQFAFVHIDANTYSGTLEACRNAIPATSPGGIVCFDDYNGVCDLGARLAIDQFLAGSGIRPSPLAGTSAFVRIPKEGAR